MQIVNQLGVESLVGFLNACWDGSAKSSPRFRRNEAFISLSLRLTLNCSSSFENEALENEDRSTKHPNLKNKAPKSQKRSTQNLKTKHLTLENEAPIENEASKTQNHCRLNNYNFTSSMTQSESGGSNGCVCTSKGRQNPSQGFIKACQLTERF